MLLIAICLGLLAVVAALGKASFEVTNRYANSLLR